MDGVYLCEDLHTSYWPDYGGGYKRRGTFIEFSKNLVDYLHAHHSNDRKLNSNEITNSLKSVHYYDGIVVLEKGEHPPVKEVSSGLATLKTTFKEPKKNIALRIVNRIIRDLLRITNSSDIV